MKGSKQKYVDIRCSTSESNISQRRNSAQIHTHTNTHTHTCVCVCVCVCVCSRKSVKQRVRQLFVYKFSLVSSWLFICSISCLFLHPLKFRSSSTNGSYITYRWSFKNFVYADSSFIFLLAWPWIFLMDIYECLQPNDFLSLSFLNCDKNLIEE